MNVPHIYSIPKNQKDWCVIKTTSKAIFYAVGFSSDYHRPESARVGVHNQKFFLRVVVPRADIPRATNSVNIVINGLAEFGIDDYDDMMEGFAKEGIASILLPLPNHFCRHHDGEDPVPADPYCRQQSPTRLAARLKKRLREKPSAWIHGASQAVNDLKKLVDRLTRWHSYRDSIEDPLLQILGRNPRVSLYGYSMGGLIALHGMLRYSHRIQAACIVNSGVGLGSATPKDMFKDTEWEELKEKIENEYHRLRLDSSPEENELLRDFYQIVFGSRKDLHKADLKRVFRRTLFILSQNDEVFPPERVLASGPNEGLTAFLVPNVGHWITAYKNKDRREWSLWSGLLRKLVAFFEENRVPDNIADEFSEALSQDFVALSPLERFRVKIALVDPKRKGRLTVIGASRSVQHDWTDKREYLEEHGIGSYVLGKVPAAPVVTCLSEFEGSNSYGLTQATVRAYLDAGVDFVACHPLESTENGAKSTFGILIVSSDMNHRTTALRNSYLEDRILEASQCLSQKLKKESTRKALLARDNSWTPKEDDEKEAESS